MPERPDIGRVPSVGSAAPRPGRGRILRLKLGYNPNSSSIGTIVFAMPAAMLGLTVAFGAAAAVLCSAVLHRREAASAAPPSGESESPGSEGSPRREKKRPPSADSSTGS